MLINPPCHHIFLSLLLPLKCDNLLHSLSLLLCPLLASEHVTVVAVNTVVAPNLSQTLHSHHFYWEISNAKPQQMFPKNLAFQYNFSFGFLFPAVPAVPLTQIQKLYLSLHPTLWGEEAPI